MKPKVREKCWQVIGVFGDKSCESLTEYLHCKHCPVYSDSAKEFFDREIPAEFLDSWTKTLSKQKETRERGDMSVTVFRLGTEYLAIDTNCFLVAVEVKPVHFVPFRTNKSFRGLVNIDGELLLCFNLETLLNISRGDFINVTEKAVYKRMIAIKTGGERIVFEVDEIIGVKRISSSAIKPLPATAQKATEIFSNGIFETEELTAGLLNETKISESFRSSLKYQ
ncbi:MAG: chemotaxis protein CheW [Ignavibacteriales bacterium]|jgi:chemotaxis-related protein WspD|nr:chemotaxis protein CheW [Ignavibacteriales bacterium]MBP7542117.1 chemotaxis protein CheW [Ignavibacteriaceae bacterium]MBK7267629.1 chemotaxis protein CheW [Ignavibacteriales bacterium]MBK8664251.1 chemotaxis protein CheW [Ignavibacteriales bacterium]MBP9122610.1 chemotaxis protein CheW [Ignavibacteriaceae bacterium]